MLLLVAATSPATSALPGPAEAAAKKVKVHGGKKPGARAPGGGPRPAARKQRSSRPKVATPKAVKPKDSKPKASAPKPAKRSPGTQPATAASAPAPTSAPVRSQVASTAPTASPPPPAAAPTTATPAPTTRARRPGAGSRRRATRRRAAGRGVAGRSGPDAARAATLLRPGAGPFAARDLSLAAPGAPGGDQRGATASRGARRPEGGSRVTRTVRDIVEVVPEALKLALLALLALSGALGGGYLMTAARARRLGRQRAELLQDVGLLQTALLPPVPATVGAMRTSVAYRPSDGPGAGGDFYDALTLPGGRAAFILGDVSGHGRRALAQTAFIRYTLRAYVEAGLEPRLALQLASPVIGEHLGGDFATVVLAVHDPRTGSLTYACAGHPAPIVVGPTRPEPVLAASSLPIGLAMRTGVRQTTVPLPPGSVVCLYTDGLAEARTRSGILGRPRLGDILEELGRDATAPALLDRVAAEARLVTDDMATVVLSPTAGVTAGGFREERLEVDLDELREGLGERFLKACGVDEPGLADAVAEARGWAASHGAVVLHVRLGIRGPIVEVLPRNVESLEAASRRRALA